MFLYTKLSVYQKAFALNKRLYQLLKNSSSIPPYIKQQLGRASLSIMLNIAEGSAKTSSKDKRNFMVIACASTFETNALIHFLASENEIKIEDSSYLSNQLEEISKMLFAMIKQLEGRDRAS